MEKNNPELISRIMTSVQAVARNKSADSHQIKGATLRQGTIVSLSEDI